ncbi:MAG: YraN family protein [Bacteroidales bacterium]|nr:YraN family protein [Bacteroidales bacterium]MBN2818596.1 YraN family protein [Bacteroidales bacterium]
MADHNDLGRAGEDHAVEFLKNAGYKILERNWRFEKKEIDIIARKENLIIIVEVKTRSTDYFGQPEESVTRAKQKYLIEAADVYLQELGFEAEVRFDIISIVKKKDKFEISHIEDAFIPNLE